MKTIIREVIDQDHPILKKLFLITRQKTFIPQPNEKFELNDYEEAIAGEEMWVAEHNGEVVGFVSMIMEDRFIHNLFVHPNWQGIGIGTKLLNKAESRLESPMELKVRRENLKACQFYQKHGWIEIHDPNVLSEPFFSYQKIIKINKKEI